MIAGRINQFHNFLSETPLVCKSASAVDTAYKTSRASFEEKIRQKSHRIFTIFKATKTQSYRLETF